MCWCRDFDVSWNLHCNDPLRPLDAGNWQTGRTQTGIFPIGHHDISGGDRLISCRGGVPSVSIASDVLFEPVPLLAAPSNGPFAPLPVRGVGIRMEGDFARASVWI